jgi:hypothetical protein
MTLLFVAIAASLGIAALASLLWAERAAIVVACVDDRIEVGWLRAEWARTQANAGLLLEPDEKRFLERYEQLHTMRLHAVEVRTRLLRQAIACALGALAASGCVLL